MYSMERSRNARTLLACSAMHPICHRMHKRWLVRPGGSVVERDKVTGRRKVRKPSRARGSPVAILRSHIESYSASLGSCALSTGRVEPGSFSGPLRVPGILRQSASIRSVLTQSHSHTPEPRPSARRSQQRRERERGKLHSPVRQHAHWLANYSGARQRFAVHRHLGQRFETRGQS